MDSGIKSWLIYMLLVMAFMALLALVSAWENVEKAKIKSQPCEQCKLIKKGK